MSDAAVTADAARRQTASAQPSVDASTSAQPPRLRTERWWDGRGWWIVPVALLFGFGFLLWQVKTHGPVTRLDLRLRNGIQGDAHDPAMSWLLRPARGMADLGDQSVALSVLFASTAVALRATRSWLPVMVAGAAIVALATVIPLKLWVARPGPANLVLGDADLGFFPSGHTADAVLCYGTSALLLCLFVIPTAPPRISGRGPVLRRAVTGGAVAIVLLTIFGLLWSNFHWFSDTLGSLCWCGAALAVLRHFTLSRVSSRPAESGRL